MATAVQESVDAHHLECMELWGGNRAVEDSVSVFGMDAWALSMPSGGAEQGGDIHYISMCGSGRIARFTVADVAGHGPAVADLAVTLRGLMKKNINRVDQTRFARALNREFAAFSRDSRFATAILTTYFAPTDHLIVCNAGHPAPLWRRSADGRWRVLEHTIAEKARSLRGLPFGVIEPTEYHQFAVQLQKGDLVLLYTDGLLEAVNPHASQYGYEALLKIMADVEGVRPEKFNRALLEAVTNSRGGQPIQDDVTLLLLRHSADNPPFPSVTTTLRVLGKMTGLVKY